MTQPAPDAVRRCARHHRETRVSCASCGEPICPACMVDTAVGIKCPTCAAPPPSVRRAFRRGVARAVAAGLVSGAAFGLIFAVVRFPYFRGVLTGLGVAEAVLRFGGRQTGGPYLWSGLAGVTVAQVVLWLLAPFPLVEPGLLIAALFVWFRLR